ncbi:MAG: hypothetical protein ABW185_08305, partial [Sedimenticola sp.]
INPHFVGQGVATPYIPNLTVGAEVYGLTGQTSSQAGFDTVQANGGPQAVGAMMLLDQGPSGLDYNWDGYDMLLMSNFGGYDFENPVLGLGSQTLSTALQQRGWMRNTDFGGAGAEILSILGSDQVYATLVPEGTIGFNGSARDGITAVTQNLSAGQAIYLEERKIYTQDDSTQIYVGDADWNSGAQLMVGYSSSGEMGIRHGGKASGQAVWLGHLPGSQGSARVSGTGSEWNISSLFNVGGGGSGTLMVEDGASVVSGESYLGHTTTASGTAIIDGSGSKWQTTGYFALGRYTGATGTATVTNGGLLDTDSWLVVGESGTGSVTVSSGGRLESKLAALGSSSAGAQGSVTVDGAGSSWYANLLAVGGWDTMNGGSGQVSVTNGGSLEVSSTLKLWNQGSLTIDGGSVTTQSIDSADGTLNHSDGSLRVDGGSFKFGAGYLVVQGSDTGRRADLTLHNAGQTDSAYDWVMLGRLENRKGDLTLSGGTRFRSGAASIGDYYGSQGSALVTGADSAWNNNGLFNVGGSGSGDLTVEGGASVVSGESYLGHTTTGIGTAVIDGSDSKWQTTGYFALGRYTGATGTATVTNGGLLDTDSWLVVGESGTGSVTVSSGGRLESKLAALGSSSAGAQGSVTVDGAGSSWYANLLAVGGWDTMNGGSGQVSITSGGSLEVSSALKLWNQGSLTIDGGSVTTKSIDSADGTLNHNDGSLRVDGGSFKFGAGYLVVQGSDTGRRAELTLHNASQTDGAYDWVLLGRLNGRKGDLTLSGGTQFSSGAASIGDYGGSQGSALVTGIGSTWNNGLFNVGGSGSGTLTVEDGASVVSGESYLGHTTTASGTAIIDGSGSKWRTTGYFALGRYAGATGKATVTNGGLLDADSLIVIGDNGTGSVTVTNGGTLNSAGSILGYGNTGSGEVTVQGVGSSWITNTLDVGGISSGNGGTGLISVSDGGLLDVIGTGRFWNDGSMEISGGSARAGNWSLEGGAVTVSGTGGLRGTSSIQVGTGSTLNSINGVLDATAINDGNGVRTGTASVQGNNGRWTTSGDLSIGGNHVGAGGEGSLNVDNGGQVNVGGSLRVWDSGTLTIGNGQTDADSVAINGGRATVDGTLNAANGVSVLGGGILQGRGTVNGLTTVSSGGIMAPGSSPGTQTFSGGLIWGAGGTYQWEINDFTGTGGSDPGWDLIEVVNGWDISGLSEAQPFNIDVISLMADNSSGDAMNFDDLLDHSFTILSYDSLIGDFDSIWFNLVLGSFSNDYDPAHSAWFLSLDESNNNLVLNYEYEVNSVPLPPSLWLFISGLAVLLLRRNNH